ncbi:MAG TPA: hypothetical protein VKO84_12280 [Gaiellaceae bacterium]|nr:hypothetical protein [Gaiellaceae bacterium]
METAFTPEPRRTPHGRFLRRVGSVLIWSAALFLGLFGIVFTFANYPWLGVGALLLLALLAAHSERRRRERRAARAERARERSRAEHRSLSND